MSSQVVTCPACRKALRSDKPLPPKATLRCPECRAAFTAPDPASPRSAVPWLIGVAAAALLGGAGITAAFLLSGGRGQPQPEAKDDDAAKKRLDEEAAKLAKARKELEAEKAKMGAAKVLEKAEAALKAKKWSEAEKLFDEVLGLSANDPAAIKGLVEARTGKALEAEGAKAEGKREADKEKLLADALGAMKEKKFDRAVPLLESARSIAPADRAVLDALAEAKAGLDADEGAKARAAAYAKHLAAGKLAADGNRFADAAREFGAALALVADSPEAKEGLKAAEAKLGGEMDLKKRQAQMDQLVERARAAQGRTLFKEAVDTMQLAVKLMPEDGQAKRLLGIYEASLKNAKTSNGKLVSKAKAHITAGQLEDAVSVAGEAVRAWAEDEAAKKTLKQAEDMLATSKKNNAAYVDALNRGTLAMAAGLYADAVRAFTEAQTLNPANIDIGIQLRNARIALDRQLRNRVEYERLVRLGTQALARQAWSEATKQFTAAQRLIPGDLAADEGLLRARYGKAMADGQRALSLKKKADATAAFQAALDLKPGDFQARQGLRQAEKLR